MLTRVGFSSSIHQKLLQMCVRFSQPPCNNFCISRLMTEALITLQLVILVPFWGVLARQSMRTWLWFVGLFLWPILFKLRGRKCIHFLRHCNYFSCHGFWKTGLQHLDKWILTVWGCGPYEAKRESNRLHSHKKVGLKESKDKRCHTSMTIMLSFSPHSFKGGLEVQNHCHSWSKKEEFVSCV